MEHILLTKLSIPFLSNSLLAFLLVLFFLLEKKPSRAKYYLATFFASYCLFFLERFLAVSIVGDELSSVAYFLPCTIMIGAGALLQFAYAFPIPSDKKESGLVYALAIFCAVGLFIFAVWRTIQPSGMKLYNAHLLSIIPLLFFVWCAFVLLRKSAAIGRESAIVSAQADRSERKSRLSQILPISELTSLKNRQGKALRDFGLLMIVPILLICMPLVEALGYFQNEFYRFLVNQCALLFPLAFMIIYLERGLDRSSLGIKTSGIVVAVMLVVFSSIGYGIAEIFENNFDKDRLLELETIEEQLDRTAKHDVPGYRRLNLPQLEYLGRLILAADGSIEAKPVFLETVAHPPSANPDFAHIQSFIITRFSKLLFFELEHGPDLTIEKARKRAIGRLSEGSLAFMESTSADLPGRIGLGEFLRHSVYFVQNGDAILVGQFSYFEFREYIHEFIQYIILFIIGSIFGILLFFLVFFHRRFVLPLNALIKGMNRVNAGYFDTRVSAPVHNEIGYLIHTFNDMLASINKSEAQLRQHMNELESVVEKRTDELKKSNMELEERNDVLKRTLEELHSVQNKMVMHEKMATLGNLVAGVSHEINTPIGVIKSFNDMTGNAIEKIAATLEKSRHSGDLEGRDKLDKIVSVLRQAIKNAHAAQERITMIISSLKNFVQLDEATFQNADIHEGLDSTINLLGHQIRDRISIKREYGDIPDIFCSPQHLNQVFMNIILNAIQAIGSEGQITIRTCLQDNRVLVEFKDNGRGIPEDRISKIFEPGFGISESRIKLTSGLSSSYHIIQTHQGDIEINSKVGEGTRVLVTLPILPIRSALAQDNT